MDNSWNGISVRYDRHEGKVVRDQNGTMRILTVQMRDGTVKFIKMNNLGPDPDPEELAKWSWFNERGPKPGWLGF